MYKTYKLYFDGACRGNPGNGSYGGVIYDEAGNIVETYNDIVGFTTNNIAEYSGLLNGLILAKEHNIENLEVYGDSLLIIKQMKGKFKVRNKKLKELYDDCKSLSDDFKMINYNHVLRENNKMADKLANTALDKIKS